jgi:hypothetical protein
MTGRSSPLPFSNWAHSWKQRKRACPRVFCQSERVTPAVRVHMLGLVEPRIGVGCGRVMHDGDPTSSLPWDAAGCMTYRAESKKARNVKTSNARGDRTAGERGNGAQIYHHKQGKTRIESKCIKCGARNRVSAGQGQVRVPYTCKECGEEQRTF